LKDLEEMKDVKNVFVEGIEEQEYYPEWMNKYFKYHALLN
jgi:DNA polymerase III alpha subunit